MQRGCPLGHGDSRQLLIALQMGSKCEFVGVSCDTFLYFAMSWAVLCYTLDICFFFGILKVCTRFRSHATPVGTLFRIILK